MKSFPSSRTATVTNKLGAIGVGQLDLLLADLVEPKCDPIHT